MTESTDTCGEVADIIGFEHVALCASTQELATQRVLELGSNQLHALLADSQRQGRGREGRRWEDPPGAALLLSIAARGPWPLTVLEDLPRRVAQLVIGVLRDQCHIPDGAVVWQSPNDLVASSGSGHGGAKLGGVLIDVHSTSSSIEHLVVGIGANLAGGHFRTSDGRTAIAVDALRETAPATDIDTPRLAHMIASRLQKLLTPGS